MTLMFVLLCALCRWKFVWLEDWCW